MRQKQLWLTILVGVLALILAACSGNESTPAAGVTLDEQAQAVGPIAAGPC